MVRQRKNRKLNNQKKGNDKMWNGRFEAVFKIQQSARLTVWQIFFLILIQFYLFTSPKEFSKKKNDNFIPFFVSNLVHDFYLYSFLFPSFVFLFSFLFVFEFTFHCCYWNKWHLAQSVEYTCIQLRIHNT